MMMMMMMMIVFIVLHSFFGGFVGTVFVSSVWIVCLLFVSDIFIGPSLLSVCEVIGHVCQSVSHQPAGLVLLSNEVVSVMIQL